MLVTASAGLLVAVQLCGENYEKHQARSDMMLEIIRNDDVPHSCFVLKGIILRVSSILAVFFHGRHANIASQR